MTNPDSNPFRRLRLIQNLSQYEIARRAGVSKHAVLRLEQGCYDNPLPSLVTYFLNHMPNRCSRAQLEEDYHEFQYQTRLDNSHLFGPSLRYHLLTPIATSTYDAEPHVTLPVGIHPLTFLREIYGINPTELSRKLCIAQNIIVYFERRSSSQKTVPKQLIKALHDAEYTEDDTDALIETYNNYRNWLRADKNLTLVVDKEVTNDRAPKFPSSSDGTISV